MLVEIKAAKNGLISMNLWMIPRTPRTKTTDYTDWHRFFCGICEICGFNHPIGVNLCQSVDVFLRNLWFLLAETEQLHFFL